MSVRIITGNALTELRRLPAESVHCCVTSPPYYGLRDYGTARWDGGADDCNHMSAASRDVCGLCGARRIDRQIGLEPSPDEYIAALVAVFREVRRVLRRDGTLWLNVGDSYCAPGGGFKPDAPSNLAGSKQATTHPHATAAIRSHIDYGCKPKDLIGIPWMLAFALRADGWYLRQDIIWSKPNPMPESVADRCTKAHEYLFLLSRSDRYWFDAAAIAEPSLYPGDDGHLRTDRTIELARPDGGSRARTAKPNGETRNRRSVWTVASQPFPESHFATFPPALIEPCILAGCPPGGTVLDPFGGAGTTGMVADRLQRNAILIELNPSYSAMGQRRIENDAGMFAEVELSDAAE